MVGRECAVRSVAASEALVRLHPTPQPPQPGSGHNKHSTGTVPQCTTNSLFD